MSTDVSPRAAVAVLATGLALFLMGAGSWSLAFQGDDLAAVLRAIDEQQFRWIWSNSFMAIGVVVTALGYRLWSDHRRQHGDAVFGNIGATLYLMGAMAWVAAVAVRLTVMFDAATKGVAPPDVSAFDDLAQGLQAAFLFLCHAGAVLMGVGLLRTSRPVGIAIIAVDGFLGLGLAVIGNGWLQLLNGPFTAHFCTGILIGFLLVKHPRPSRLRTATA